MTISEKIKMLRGKNLLSQKELANRIGVSPTTLCYWENNNCDINKKYIKAIADVLETSVAELLSNDEASCYDRLAIENKNIGKWIQFYRKQENIKQNELSKLLNVSPALVSRIEQGHKDIRDIKYRDVRDKLYDLFPGLQKRMNYLNNDSMKVHSEEDFKEVPEEETLDKGETSMNQERICKEVHIEDINEDINLFSGSYVNLKPEIYSILFNELYNQIQSLNYEDQTYHSSLNNLKIKINWFGEFIGNNEALTMILSQKINK